MTTSSEMRNRLQNSFVIEKWQALPGSSPFTFIKQNTPFLSAQKAQIP